METYTDKRGYVRIMNTVTGVSYISFHHLLHGIKIEPEPLVKKKHQYG